jgi:hypothetical protein
MGKLDRIAGIESWPLRTCQTRHECNYCPLPIRLGDKYYDGGYGHRYHQDCLQTMKTAAEETLNEALRRKEYE